MKSPQDAYREGYEAAKSATIGDIAAELTMGMMRDDPGGYFAAGYRDGAGDKAFNPPPLPQVQRSSPARGLIPKFSENPAGWFLAIIFVVEFWLLWQFIKAPFELLSGKTSPWIITKNVALATIMIAAVWFGYQSSPR